MHRYHSSHGFTWIDDYVKEYGDNLVEFPGLLLRSAFEFIFLAANCVATLLMNLQHLIVTFFLKVVYFF